MIRAVDIPRVDPRPGDFRGTDGLVRCGTCGEPREQVFDALPNLAAQRLPRSCKCDREREALEAERDRLAKRAEQAERFREECFPFDALKAMTFEADDRSNPRVTERCERYADRFEDALRQRAGLLFWGPVGSGKTYHAASIANRVIDMGHSAVFTSISRISAEMSAARFTGASRVLDELLRHELIVLDDLGTERGTETAREQANEIVDALSVSSCVPIITTNMSVEAMQAETDPTLQRIYSRIFGMCQPVKVEHADRRLSVSEGRADFYRSIW